MKSSTCIIAFALALTMPAAAVADTRTAELCGSGHANEVVSDADVRPNPVGFYVASLGEQVEFGDPRIILGAGDAFYLCTRAAATPDMDASKALLVMREREVKVLFVPILPRRPGF